MYRCHLTGVLGIEVQTVIKQLRFMDPGHLQLPMCEVIALDQYQSILSEFWLSGSLTNQFLSLLFLV